MIMKVDGPLFVGNVAEHMIVEEIDIGTAELFMEPHECVHGESHSYEKFLMLILHDTHGEKEDITILVPTYGAFYEAIANGDFQRISQEALDE